MEEMMEEYVTFHVTAKDGSDVEMVVVDEFDFEDIYDPAIPLITQIEQNAEKYNIELPIGYKVELAKAAKSKILKLKENDDVEKQNIWLDIFNQINN